MEGRRNVFGIVAVVLGALALIVALSGRMQPNFSVNIDGYRDQPQAGAVQVAPAAPQQGSDRLDNSTKERSDHAGEHGMRGFQGMMGDHRGMMGDHRGMMGDHDRRGGGFFPFFIIGGLLKFLLAFGLILLGLRLFRGRRGGGGGFGGWRGRPAHYEPMPGDHRKTAAHTSENNYL